MKRILVLTAGILLLCGNLYAGNGDIVANGSVKWGTSGAILSTDQGASIELRGSGIPFIDFSNDSTSDYDMRIILTGDDVLDIDGGNVGIGTSTPGIYKLYVSGITYSSSGYQSSDSKFKKDILSIDNALDKAQKLNGVTYEWKTDENKDKGFPAGRHYGVIAQDVEKVLPEAVMTDTDGNKAVAYSEIIPVLIEAIKAQQKSIDDLQNTVTQLQAKSNSK